MATPPAIVFVFQERKAKSKLSRGHASQFCPQTQSHGHALPGETGEASTGVKHITSPNNRGSVSEEEGEYACWADNFGSSNMLEREAASRQLSRRSSHFLQMQVRAVTLLVTSLSTTNSGIKPTGNLHIVCRTRLCAVSDTKDSVKKLGSAIQLQKHGLKFRRPKFKCLLCPVLLIRLRQVINFKFFMWKWKWWFALRFKWDDVCKESYGRLSINITSDDDGFHLKCTQPGHFNLLWYRSHFILINLHLSPRSRQSILPCTGIIESALCRLGMLTYPSAALPFRYSIPIFFRMISL